MDALRRIAVMIEYEWRRALAKKKVLALIILAVVFQALPFIIFTRITLDLAADAKATMWVVGALGGQSLFIQLVAIIVAGGSMSEEYEHGTADILFSKPIKRLEYLAGKFAGGFSLLITIEAVMVAIGVFLGFGFFGPQKYLQFAFVILGSIIYSSLLFFSLTFMFSELIRKTTLAILACFGVFMVSQVLYGVLLVLSMLSAAAGTPNEFYLNVSKLLPTWSASNLPTFVASEVMPVLNNPLVSLTTGEVALAVLVIAVYTVVSISIASVRLVKSDVAKKTD